MGIIKDCPRSAMEKCTDKYGCRGACRAVEQFEKEWREENLTSEKNIQISDTKPAESARAWVGLTDEEVKTAWSQLWFDLNNGKFASSDDPSRHTTVMFARAIEAKLKEKNT